MTRYAEGTKVPAAKTRGEMQTLLEKHGCARFGWDKTEAGEALLFSLKGMTFRIEIKRPTPERVKGLNAERFRQPWLRDLAADIEAEYRRRWRANLILLKTKLEFVDDEGDELLHEFLPYALTSSGQTLGELVAGGGLPMLTAGDGS
jgi:hypothetical protein